MIKDLTSFIAKVKEEQPGDVLRISHPTQPHNFDCTALLQHLDNRGQYPLTIFDNAENLLGKRSEYVLLMNMFGKRERIALALDMPASQCKLPLSLEFARREQQQVPPTVIARGEAPVQEVVETGDDADIRKLPIPRHHEMDIGPYITMATVVRDPDDGTYNVSFVKSFCNNPRSIVTCIHSAHHMRIQKKYESRGQRMPIIHVLGHHPAFYLGSLALTPIETDDYATIGSFLGQPLRLVASVTWGDKFMVPADAEVIVEGELPPGVRDVMNPFGEWAGDYQPQHLRPITEITAITHRKHAIMEGIFPGHAGHWNLGSVPKEGSVFNDIKVHFPSVTAVHLPHSAAGRASCYIAMKKTKEGEAKLMGLQALLSVHFVGWVIVVDDHIDVYNERDVIWATISYVNPKRDITFIENAGSNYVAGRTKVVIDATKPLDHPMPSMIRVPEEAMARVNLDEWLKG